MVKVKYDRTKHNRGLKYAMNGISYVASNHPNFFLHIIFFLITMFASVVYQVNYYEFLIILLSSSIVFVAEMLNTAIEVLGDEVAKGKKCELVRIAKDSSAGAVLLSAYFAVLIAIIIFAPKIYVTFYPYIYP